MNCKTLNLTKKHFCLLTKNVTYLSLNGKKMKIVFLLLITAKTHLIVATSILATDVGDDFEMLVTDF